MRRIACAGAATLLLTAGLTMPNSAGAAAYRRTMPLTAECTVSVPNTYAPQASPMYHSVAFEATRDGKWAGVKYNADGARLSVISWHPHGRVHRLARFEYVHSRVYDETSVFVIGIGPHGGVVARVQRERGGFAGPYVGLIWRHGARHRLAMAPSWRSAYPRSMTSDGAVIGTVDVSSGKHPDYWIVRWSPGGRHFEKLLHFGRRNPEPRADGAGDIVFVQGSEHTPYVRAVSGAVQPLRGYDSRTDVLRPQLGGPGHTILGYGDPGLVRWEIRADGSQPRPVQLSRRVSYPGAVGSRGDVFADAFGERRPFVLTARGTQRSVAHQLQWSDEPSGVAVDEHGKVAFTSAKDGLVHFVRCH